VSSFFGKGSGQRAGWLTKRAPDVWESARFTSIFLASSFFLHLKPFPSPPTRG